METAIEELPAYRSTIDRLEKLRQEGSNGQEYWMARDIHPVLGYPVWDKFEPVIERAASSFTANTIDPSHHIARASKMMELGGGGKREGLDYFLSRAACRLIAMNGDPSKAEIAAAQAYFVVQTHRMEAEDALTQDEKRLNLRDKVTTAFRTVSGVAKEAGVPNSKQALFHDARYQGLYDMPRRDVMARKGLKREDNPFDYAGPLELSANDFR
ncbi:BRO family protein [Mesorhizobium sp. M1143]|uniref:BRO family protein n=1 Tax=Mesorhizobium sp. M1143 TaxID=2957061 RepID=UPI0033366ABB